jgi:hypothetical protein
MPVAPRPVKSWPFTGPNPPKPENTLTRGAPGLSLDSSMSRTPNASKSIFAFVAGITLR